MGYLVENDHAHIDFHKGTHGYPIKNADDMMKPCPLMPDGYWICGYFEADHYDDVNKYLVWNMRYSKDGTNWINTKPTYGWGGNWSVTDMGDGQGYTANALYFTQDGTKQIAECRCAFTGKVYNTVDMQTTSAWRLLSTKTQVYTIGSFHNPTTNVSNVYTRADYESEENGDEDDIFRVYAYVYVIPRENLINQWNSITVE